MSPPKRHHYVPQMILNGFTDQNGWLHWCRLEQSPPAVRPARPAELFLEKHLYSTVSEGGIKDPAMEKELSQLESEAAAVIGEMIAAARADRPPALSRQQKQVWYLFFLMQWRRAPEAQRSIASDAELSQMLDEALEAVRILVPQRRDEIETLSTPEAKKRIMRNVRVDSLRQLRANVMGVLEKRGITVLRIRRHNKSFIVGSRPVVKITPRGRTDLNDPVVEMWLPIALDVAAGVGLGNGNGNGSISLFFLDNDKPIRQLNCAIASQSSVIASCSPALTRSIVRAR